MTIAIILAAGKGNRMSGSLQAYNQQEACIPKQFMDLCGKPVLRRTLELFDSIGEIDELVLVLHGDGFDYYDRLFCGISFQKPLTVVEGGENRQESSYRALCAVKDRADIVLIHDAVRPFVTAEIVRACLEQTRLRGAAITAVPPKDTIKVVNAEDTILYTPNRSELRIVQCPQGFAFDVVYRAHERARQDDFQSTDDSALVERYEMQPVTVPGSYNNIKITTLDDLYLAELLLKGGNG